MNRPVTAHFNAAHGCRQFGDPEWLIRKRKKMQDKEDENRLKAEAREKKNAEARGQEGGGEDGEGPGGEDG
jgi:hypothetical protein